jgi:NitT/TauT family transport system permease protein
MSPDPAAAAPPAAPTSLLAKPNVLRVVAPATLGVLLLALWQFICSNFDVPVYLVPSPKAIASTLVEDWGLLSSALLTTLKITFLAFAMAVVLGVAAAFVFVQSRLIEVSLFPYAVIMQVTPIVAIAPLIIIWVKDPTPAMVICATIVALFPIISNTILGLRSVNPGLMNLFRLNKATRWQTLVRLRVPSALPYFFGGLRISSGLALIGAVVAEFVAGTGGTASGLAYQILQSGFQLNIPRLFAALFLITLTGVVLFTAMAALSKWALRWHESEMN